jgi:hypothetical protein
VRILVSKTDFISPATLRETGEQDKGVQVESELLTGKSTFVEVFLLGSTVAVMALSTAVVVLVTRVAIAATMMTMVSVVAL